MSKFAPATQRLSSDRIRFRTKGSEVNSSHDEEEPIGVGDMVRESWSGFPGTVVVIENDEAIVEYPNGGRRLRSQVEWRAMIRTCG